LGLKGRLRTDYCGERSDSGILVERMVMTMATRRAALLTVLAFVACVLACSAPVSAKAPDASHPSVQDADDRLVAVTIANANACIEQAIAQAQHLAEATPQDTEVIIARLLVRVDEIVTRALRVIGDRAVVECDYVEVAIGGQAVLVDPLKVAGS